MKSSEGSTRRSSYTTALSYWWRRLVGARPLRSRMFISAQLLRWLMSISSYLGARSTSPSTSGRSSCRASSPKSWPHPLPT